MTLCKALTKQGKRCKNYVGKGRRDYCARHSQSSRGGSKKGRGSVNTKRVISRINPIPRRIKQRGG